MQSIFKLTLRYLVYVNFQSDRVKGNQVVTTDL